MKFLIAPGTFDCNRGDQALLWEAMDALRRADLQAQLAVMSDVYDRPEDPQIRQTRQLDVRILPSLLPNPRRWATPGKYEIIDSGWSLMKMRVRAVLDFLQSVILVACPRSHFLARLMLGHRRLETYEYLRQCKALVVKGGGFIHAYRGLRSAYYLWFAMFPLLLTKRCNVMLILLPNSFGPFSTRWSRWLSRRVLGRADLVTAREPLSQQALNALVGDKVKLYPDMAFLLSGAGPEWARAELGAHGIRLGARRYVGLTMRPYRFPNSDNPVEMYHRYVGAFAAFMEYLLEKGFVPVLFAHGIGPHANEDDRVALRAMLQASPHGDRAVSVDGDYDCRKMKALYGQMNYMVCTRFHSAIFSISQNVPCMAVSYSGHKADGIMGEIGIGNLVLRIDQVDGPAMIRVFEELVAQEQTVRQRMKTYVATCRRRLVELDRELAQVLGTAAASGSPTRSG